VKTREIAVAAGGRRRRLLAWRVVVRAEGKLGRGKEGRVGDGRRTRRTRERMMDGGVEKRIDRCCCWKR
jgi:hypothetical protein